MTPEEEQAAILAYYNDLIARLPPEKRAHPTRADFAELLANPNLYGAPKPMTVDEHEAEAIRLLAQANNRELDAEATRHAYEAAKVHAALATRPIDSAMLQQVRAVITSWDNGFGGDDPAYVLDQIRRILGIEEPRP